MAGSIICKMTCYECGKEQLPFFVRRRKDGEDIISFLEEIKKEIAVAHSIFSPRCKGSKVDLYLPMDNPKGPGF